MKFTTSESGTEALSAHLCGKTSNVFNLNLTIVPANLDSPGSLFFISQMEMMVCVEVRFRSPTASISTLSLSFLAATAAQRGMKRELVLLRILSTRSLLLCSNENSRAHLNVMARLRNTFHLVNNVRNVGT